MRRFKDAPALATGFAGVAAGIAPSIGSRETAIAAAGLDLTLRGSVCPTASATSSAVIRRFEDVLALFVVSGTP